jgi:HD superfamily phosphohydrolase
MERCGVHDNDNPYLECALPLGHPGPHSDRVPTHDDAESDSCVHGEPFDQVCVICEEAERVEVWLSEVVRRACEAVSKGDAPDAIASYLSATVGARLSQERQLREEAERLEAEQRNTARYLRDELEGAETEKADAERQLHEAREELKRSYKRNDEVLDRALRAERLAGDLRADVEEAKHEADIRLDNERRSWTQLERCQEALQEITEIKHPTRRYYANPAFERAQEIARSALSQQSVPNTPEGE